MMESYTVKSFAQLNEEEKKQATEVFVEGFFPQLKLLSKDREKLVRLFQPTFSQDQVFGCVYRSRIVGIVGYSTTTGRAQTYQRENFIKELGWFKGRLIYKMLSRELESVLQLRDKQCYIESLATAENMRGKGVATALISYLLVHLDDYEHMLEVADTNQSAIQIYERLGFEVDKIKPLRLFRWMAGYNALLFMKYVRSVD